MAELDNLLGSRISLISQVDVRYDGVLFSINAKESSIVLKDVRCLGTEERVSDASKKVSASHGILAFVAFPGSDIKDLYLHDYDSATPEPAAPEPPKRQPQEAVSSAQQAAAPQQQQQKRQNDKVRPVPTAPSSAPAQASQHTAKKPAPAAQQQPSAPVKAAPAGSNRGIGTGEHLLHLRVKKTSVDQSKPENSSGVFDFAAALSAFNKTEVMESVAKDKEAENKGLYKKDDFFDTLSCDVLDREMGHRTHMTNSEERTLNQDTFGAVALQSNYSRGRGRGGGRGNGRGGQQSGQHPSQQQGRGRGRGGGRGYTPRGRGASRGRGPQNTAAA